VNPAMEIQNRLLELIVPAPHDLLNTLAACTSGVDCFSSIDALQAQLASTGG
jgi:hypothetical protein